MPGKHDVQQAISDATTVLRAATERGEATTGGTSLVVALRARYESLMNLAYGVAVDDSQKTPWAGVNALVGGFRPGELVVWPSAPKMGKSAALTMLADFVSAHYGAVAMFALKMGVDALAMRLLALHSSISARAQRVGELSDADLERIAAAQKPRSLTARSRFSIYPTRVWPTCGASCTRSRRPRRSRR